jgi:hypothetical protein
MSATLILPPAATCSAHGIERWITAEQTALTAAIFAETPGLCWNGAWNAAAAELPGLLEYAAQWDADAARQAAEGQLV